MNNRTSRRTRKACNLAEPNHRQTTQYPFEAACFECNWKARFTHKRFAIASIISHITWQHQSTGEHETEIARQLRAVGRIHKSV